VSALFPGLDGSISRFDRYRRSCTK
jgi:hypothetical protein